MAYWLMKSEPDVFSIDDLKSSARRTEHWDGVRNYQARNFMRDDMKKGDQAFFYHSNCAVPGIAGIVEIAREAYPDFTALDPQSSYYDPKSDPEHPRWYMVDVRFVCRIDPVIALSELKQHDELRHMRLLQRGNRLSVMPVTASEWQYILDLIR